MSPCQADERIEQLSVVIDMKGNPLCWRATLQSMNKRYLRILAVLWALVPGLALADTAALDTFMAEVNAFSAEFEQTVYDADGATLQSSSGTVVLERPARFRWEYAPQDGEEAGQVLVADGERVWLYDPGLEQVTVNRIDERVAGTPLVVLMGNEPLDTAFNVSSLGAADGVDWFELAPSAADSDFETVYVGFSGGGLAAMELRDSFGQATQIRFEQFDGTIDPDDSVFQFDPPAGVDVIGAEQ